MIHNQSYSAATGFGVFHWTSLIDFHFASVIGGAGRRPDAILDLGRHRHEGLLHVCGTLGRSFKEWNA